MGESLQRAIKQIERSEKSNRRKKLFHLIQAILDGKIDSSNTPLAKIFNQKAPRFNYVSPRERATHNYGYMEVDEMLAGTPFYGES